MKYQYVVILKKTGQRAIDLLSIFLCFFSAICLGYIGLHSAGSRSELYVILGIGLLLLIGLGIVWLSGRRMRMRHDKVRYRYLLLLAAMGWMFFTPAPWVGGLFLVLTFLEYQTKRPLEIGFDNDRVVINTLMRQEFEWKVFNNIILKDGLLTLDFKSNRLIQKEVTEDDEEDDADEEEFNVYCRGRLAAAAAATA
ncbi:hypothetical protein [Puia sp.]|jgi:hypothetical protein|uniref:hypothetical protein n=1 Tax=Puia sp. TaxID=2045100 RepID=UPI002F40F847